MSIRPEFAQSFVTRVYRQLRLHVNIMNEKAVIIASSIPERIGDFHQSAYSLLERGSFMDCVEESLGNVRPGVNLLLTDGAEPMGVVGVSGHPEEVLQVAKTIKFALEAMLENEANRDGLRQVSGEGSRLSQALLFEVPSNPARILKLTRQQGLSPNYPRRMVLLVLGGDEAQICSRALDSCFSKIPSAHSQDLLLPVDSQHAILLKALPSPSRETPPPPEVWREELEQALKNRLENHRDYFLKYFYGPIQTTLLQSHRIFEGLRWLERDRRHSRESVFYFRDFFVEYMVAHWEEELLSPYFEYDCSLVDGCLGSNLFQTTVGVLIDTGMNSEEAARRLFIHKNTLTARIKKIKDVLGIQPLTDTRDAIFLAMLHRYYSGIR